MPYSLGYVSNGISVVLVADGTTSLPPDHASTQFNGVQLSHLSYWLWCNLDYKFNIKQVKHKKGEWIMYVILQTHTITQ